MSRPTPERPERVREDRTAPESELQLELALERWENEGGAAPPPAPAAVPNPELELEMERWEDNGGAVPAPAPTPEGRQRRERAAAAAGREDAQR